VEEGELSFYEITHFFPEDVKLRGHDLTTFGPSNKKPSYAGISATAKELAVYLQATDIPVPDLLSLAKRYIEELQLPGVCVFHIVICSKFKSNLCMMIFI
jgi:hypothetical protein